MKLSYASATAMYTPLLDKVEAVAVAGFDAITISTRDLVGARDAGFSDAHLVAAVRDSALEVSCVGGVTRWLNGVVTEEEDLAFEAAALFGTSEVVCTPTQAPFNGVDQATDAFRGLCDRAAEHGLRTRLEFVGHTDLRDLLTAWEIVRRADRLNGGLLIDNCHMHVGGSTFDQIAIVAPEKVFGVQVADLPADGGRRVLPGEGMLDVVGFIRAIDAALGTDVMYEGEPVNPRWDEEPASASATQLYRTLRAVVEEATR